jgi:hypothetical protein
VAAIVSRAKTDLTAIRQTKERSTHVLLRSVRAIETSLTNQHEAIERHSTALEKSWVGVQALRRKLMTAQLQLRREVAVVRELELRLGTKERQQQALEVRLSRQEESSASARDSSSGVFQPKRRSSSSDLSFHSIKRLKI